MFGEYICLVLSDDIFCRRTFSSSAADQVISRIAQLPAGELPALVSLCHHLVGQLLRHPRDRAWPHGAASHHTTLTRHDV